MGKKNKQTSETNKSGKISPKEIAILDKFEEDIKKQARALQDSLSDMSAHKLASAFFKCFGNFMVEARATILCDADQKLALKVFDVLLSRTLKQAEEKIKDESEIIHRAFVRTEELEKTLQPDQIDEEAIINEEADKYYAEKKNNGFPRRACCRSSGWRSARQR